jgi:hypothetical protein
MKLSKLFLKTVSSLVIAVGLIGLAGCLDEIEFDSSSSIDDGIAIQGKLVLGSPSFVSITIRKVFNFKDTPRLISARSVVLEDEDGNEVEIDSKADGVYYRELDNLPNFKVEYGRSYKLKVSTFDNRNFESTLDEIYPVSTPESLEVKRTQVETQDVNGNNKLFDQLTYTVSTPLKPEGATQNARILWEMVSTYKFSDTPTSYGQRSCRPVQIDEENKTCYLTSSPVKNYVVINGPTLSSDRVDNFEILNTPLSSLYSEGFYLTVLQQSLSPESLDYWSQVNQVVDRTGGIFQAPAGKVRGNFTNVDDPKDEVFGFFYATEERVQRVFVSPEMADNPPLPCPSATDDFGRAANDCCNCTTITGSTTVKPSWWLQ